MRVLDEAPRSRVLIRADGQRDDDHVAFVALETVHGADAEVERGELVHGEPFEHGALERVRLCPEGRHQAHAADPSGEEASELAHRGGDLFLDDAGPVAGPCESNHLDAVLVTGRRARVVDLDGALVQAAGDEVDQMRRRAEVLVQGEHG